MLTDIIVNDLSAALEAGATVINKVGLDARIVVGGTSAWAHAGRLLARGSTPQ